MPHQIPLAKNTSTNKFQELKVNSAGKLEVSDSVVNVNTDGLETLVSAGNNTLSSIDNKVILPSVLDSDRLKVIDSAVIGSLAQINNNVDGLEGKLDTIDGSINTIEGCVSGSELQVDIVSGSVSVSGVSTEAKQDTIITHIDGVEGLIGDTNSKIDAMRGSNSITDLATKLNAGLPSALSSDRLKCVLDADLADTNSKIDAMRGSNSITDLATKLNAGLPSALSSDRLKCVLDANLADTNNKLTAIQTAVELLDNCVNGNELQVDIVSSAAGGDASAGNQTTMISRLDDIKTAVEILDNAVSGNELQVDVVSSALPSGASTATHQTTIIGHLDGVEGLIGTTNTNLGTIETDIETTNTKLGTIETDIEAILSKNTEIDTAIDAMSAKLPASLGQKANSSSLSICRSSTTGAFDMSCRTTIGTSSTSTKLLCDSAGRLKVENNAPIELFSDTSSTIAQNNTFTSSEISLVNGKKVGVLINTGSIDPQLSGKILIGFAGDADQQLIGSSGSAVQLPLAQIDGAGDYHATAVFDCPFPVLKVQLKNMNPSTITSLIVKVYQ
tara:strand:- start:556 stop:2232 length:1677 start_codon:yes stop_codon:yes gene_type:complete